LIVKLDAVVGFGANKYKNKRNENLESYTNNR
jgi:hypothetical protein